MSDKKNYNELVANIVEKHYGVVLDPVKNFNIPLPPLKFDLLFEIKPDFLNALRKPPLPFLAEINIIQIKTAFDPPTVDDIIRNIGQLYILSNRPIAKGKTVALTMISAERISENIIQELRVHPIIATDIPWIYEIKALETAYSFVLDDLPEHYLEGSPFSSTNQIQNNKQKIIEICKYWLEAFHPEYH